MNDVTQYRGPDGSGSYFDENVSLGHRRLAIIDLSPLGKQPMSDSRGQLHLVYNGEIYNFHQIRQGLKDRGHIFQSHSDTEVILLAYAEYGLDAFNLLNGMWGLCLYDKTIGRLILCRDRFGVKPLYYHLKPGGGLIFSSMITSIALHPGVGDSPEDSAVFDFLAYNLEQHDERTFFKGISSLPPGHLLIYDLRSGKAEVRRWYTLTPRTVGGLEELAEAFDNSVRLRTVSDVPVGVCLSGGVDSSAIAGLLSRHLNYPFQAFSMVAPGSAADESRYIDIVAAQTGAKVHRTEFTAYDLLNDFDDFVACQEEPVAGTSAFAQYRIFKLARECGAKVLLDGQGGDELFAGYVYYFGYLFLELFNSFRLGRLAKEILGYRRAFGNWFGLTMFGFLTMPQPLQKALFRLRVAPWVNFGNLAESGGIPSDPRWSWQGVRQSLNATLLSTSIPHNLMWADKSSMRFGVECREPFLDVTLVEMAASLTPEQLIGDGRTKRMFKEAIRNTLPKAIRERTDKVGFEADENALYRDPTVVKFAREVLYSSLFASRPYWHADKVRRIFESHQAGRIQVGQNIWKWLNVETWLRQHFDNR